MDWYNTFESVGETLSPLANILEVIGSALASGVVVYTFMRKRYKAQQVVEEHLEDALALRRRQLAEMEAERDLVRSRADQYDPNVWLERFDKEQKEGNEARAAQVLRAGVSCTTLSGSEHPDTCTVRELRDLLLSHKE